LGDKIRYFSISSTK